MDYKCDMYFKDTFFFWNILMLEASASLEMQRKRNS